MCLENDDYIQQEIQQEIEELARVDKELKEAKIRFHRDYCPYNWKALEFAKRDHFIHFAPLSEISVVIYNSRDGLFSDGESEWYYFPFSD